MITETINQRIENVIPYTEKGLWAVPQTVAPCGTQQTTSVVVSDMVSIMKTYSGFW